MPSDLSPFVEKIEWEACQRPVMLADRRFPELLPPECRSVTIRRNEQYQLVAEIEGKVAEIRALAAHQKAAIESAPPGTVLRAGMEVDCGDEVEDVQVCLDQFGSYTAELSGEERGKWEATRDVRRYYRRERVLLSEGHLEPLWLTEWYLNGPQKMVFGRITSHQITSRYVRTRDGKAPTEVRSNHVGGTRDHALVDLDNLSFVVHAVPSEIGPGWARPVGIEYRRDDKRAIPPESTRRAIEEIVSFVLGRRLMRVGFTSFNAAGDPIEVESINPWGTNIRETCGSCDDSPFPIQINIEGSIDVETLLNLLVPRYLQSRDELKLGEALVQYWAACEAPLGPNLVLHRAAVEGLKTAWFESTRTKSRRQYMNRSDFDALLGDVLREAERKLSGVDKGDRILRRMKDANNMGSNEEVENFFAEIRLALGKTEEDARHAQNAPAHGRTIKSNEDLLKWTRHYAASRVLFQRTLLQLLGYEGDYLDKTTIGIPIRPISEPAGGSGAG